MSSDIVWVCSIDIGKKNFAFYIEEFDVCDINKLPLISKNKRYNEDGSLSVEFSGVVKEICKNGKNILYENIDLTTNCKNVYFDSKILYNLTELLDLYHEYWVQCDTFLIEKQMSFKNAYNTMALKIAQHCWSYFSIKYRGKGIVEFPAYYKTEILGSKKNIKYTKKGVVKYESVDKVNRKKWAIEKAMSILAERNDFITISQLSSVKKKDDLADVLCQLQAYKILHFIDKII